MNDSDSALTHRVIEIAADVFGIASENLSKHSSTDSVDAWDSISHLNLMLSLEQAFGTTIPPERMPELKSIEKVVAELRRLGLR